MLTFEQFQDATAFYNKDRYSKLRNFKRAAILFYNKNNQTNPEEKDIEAVVSIIDELYRDNRTKQKGFNIFVKELNLMSFVRKFNMHPAKTLSAFYGDKGGYRLAIKLRDEKKVEDFRKFVMDNRKNPDLQDIARIELLNNQNYEEEGA